MGQGDTITIQGIHVRAAHGVLETEKSTAQDFYVDVEVNCDTVAAARSDNVADAVNYAKVTERVVRVMAGDSRDLIETLAHRVADAVLEDTRIERTTVTINKPDAPIPHEFSNVSVTVKRDGVLRESGERRYVVSIGSNLGDPEDNVRRAIEAILPLFVDAQVSSMYRSAPVLAPGQAEQPAYVNAVVVGMTQMPPLDLLEFMQRVEGDLGRVRTERWGARTADLDLIVASGLESNHPRLLLPHPGSHERRFVLEPWHEVEPDACLSGTPIAELLEAVQDQEITRIEIS